MGTGILLIIALVLCFSLLARLMISQLFSQRVFDDSSTLPLVPGIDENLLEEKKNPAGRPKAGKKVSAGRNGP